MALLQDPWAEFTPAPNEGDPWAEFTEEQPARPRRGRSQGRSRARLAATGDVVDGDTLRLSDRRNARLYGIDAFEARQTGQGASGPVPIGQQSRGALAGLVTPDTALTATGALTYGRPVVMATQPNALAAFLPGTDVAQRQVETGDALAAPAYLADDPARLRGYMEAERLARLNRRGAHSTQFVDPKAYRAGQGPWAAPEASTDGKGVAVFKDEPMPFAGLRPEIEQGYLDLLAKPDSTAGDVLAYAERHGFAIDRKDVDTFIANRKRGVPMSRDVAYRQAPRVLTDIGDGAGGAAVRGFADPLNLLDEAGAVVDTLGGTGGRESIFNSDRRFGDILANNLDQNRSILDADDANHPYARFGGQLAGGLLLPGGAVQGVGRAAGATALREGLGMAAARATASQAVTRRLATAGAIEGAVAGAGAGETVRERAGGAALGGVAGGLLGAGTATIGQAGSRWLAARAAGKARGKSPAGADLRAQVAPYIDELVATAGDDPDAQAAVRATLDAVGPGYSVTDAVADIREAASPMVRRHIREEAGTDPDTGPHGPILYDLANDYPAAIARMQKDDAGEVPGAIKHPVIGDVDLIWGTDSYGMRHIIAKHPEVVDDLPAIVSRLPVKQRPDEVGNNRWVLEDDTHRAIIAPDFDGVEKRWVVSAFQRKDAPGDQTSRRDPLSSPGGGSPGNGATGTISDQQALGNVRPLLDDATPAVRQAQADRIEPRDVLPIPASEVASEAEAAGIQAGRFKVQPKGDERDVLTARNYQDRSGQWFTRRGPADLVTWLREQGGLAPDGDLRAMGIDNGARRGVDFAQSENRLGDLISDRGMSLDDAAEAAWEAGYLPGAERPDLNTFLQALDDTWRGTNRAFRPEDADEVMRFQAARDHRLAVEQARDEGAPLVTDRSEALTADERPVPPLEAYEEWGQNAPDFAGNIRLEGLDSPQAIKRALVATDQRAGGFDAARRGRITQAETERLAGELGMTADDLLKRRKGQALNAEQALAARQILARSGNELVNMARRIQRLDNPGDELTAEFRKAWVRHVAIQEQVAGATSEAGRALAQFRQVADSRLVQGNVLDGLSALVAGGRGQDRLKEAADMILDASADPGALARISRDALKPQFKDKLIELWYNYLLSGPQTHVVNVMSNTLTSLAQIPEHMIAAGLGGVRQGGARLARQQADTDRVMFSETGARVIGLLQGAREGLVQAARTFRTGEPSDFVTKVEAQAQRAIGGIKGSIIRTPTRALAAEDEFFKSMARRMELAGLSMRQARKDGLKGDAARQRAAELLADPSDEMLSKAFDYGRYLTFQRPLGPFASKVSAMTQAWPWLKLFIPFVRTPVNLLKFSVERSPAAPLLKEWRKEFVAGGASRDLAMARAMVGTGAMMLVAEMAAGGKITGGGPADPEAKRLLLADGWQPYSLKVGDRYVSYQRLDPFASTFGIAADWVDLQTHMTDKQSQDVATLLVASTLQNIGSKTWLSGLSDALDAIGDPGRYGQTFVARMAGSLAVPTVMAQTTRALDPVLREARSPLDRIRSRIPGLSDDLEARRDVWGRPIVSQGGLGPDFLSPIWQDTRENDPLSNELLANGIGIPAPSRKIKGVELSASDYGRYQEQIGLALKRDLGALVESPAWQRWDRDTREDEARKVIAKTRRAVRESFVVGGTDAASAANDPWSEFTPAPSSGGDASDPWSEFTPTSSVYEAIRKAIPGIGVTSGYRTAAYQDDMRRRGYRPARNSGHLTGSSLDLTPPPGKSMGWLMRQVRAIYPDAKLLNEGDHVHATFPGYEGAPALGGARSAGLVNPMLTG